VTDSTPPAAPASLFDGADLIHAHTRAQLLADGDLVAVDPAVAKQAGFRIPVAISRAAHVRCVALTPAAERAGNDVAGRLWDVLWMCRRQVQRDASTFFFQLYVVTDNPREPELVTLRATVDGGDDGDPVITILCDDED